MKKARLLVLGVFALGFVITSCKKIKADTVITVSNTLQTAADPSAGGTGGNELPIETILGLPGEALFSTETIKDGIEFSGFLNGLYDIDVESKSITFTLVAAANDPNYSSFYRTLEAGTFDRYYLSFDQEHKIKKGESSDPSVSLEVVSDTEVVVVTGEGYSFNPGTTFTIDLK